MRYLEITEVVLIHCNAVNYSYQQKSRIVYTFVLNKTSIIRQLLDILSKNCIFLKPFDSEFSYIEVLLADQNSNDLEIKDKINITLLIK